VLSGFHNFEASNTGSNCLVQKVYTACLSHCSTVALFDVGHSVENQVVDQSAANQ